MKKITIPRHFSKEAKGLWKNILSEYDIEDSAGLAILQTALEAFDRLKEAQKEIERNGMTMRDRWGQVKPNPLLPVERDSRAQFLQGLKALNLDLEPLRDTIGRPGGTKQV